MDNVKDLCENIMKMGWKKSKKAHTKMIAENWNWPGEIVAIKYVFEIKLNGKKQSAEM